MSETVTIYGLCHPETGELRYVGKANNLESRIRCHRWEARSSSLHTRKVNWLRSLSTDPVVTVLEECTKDNWAEAERRWIAVFRTQGARLTNFADGGQTSPVEGKRHSEESKSKMRAASLRLGLKPPSRKGQPVTAEAKAKQRATSLRLGLKPPPMGGWNKGIRKTHCPSGHEYSPENTLIQYRRSENRLFQSCRQCRQQWNQSRRLRRVA